MRKFLACTSLTPIMLIAAGPVHADTEISTARTTPIATGTDNDDIRITNQGSIRPTSGTAVTVNSDHDVTNQGTVQITGSNGASGIVAEAGRSATITNSGSIVMDEDFTPEDTDDDGDLDGPFAQGRDRFGIRTLGALNGSVVNSGTITIEGNNSAAISLEGPLTGSLNQSGTITVTGNDSVGIRAGAVSGNVTIRGSVTARGEDAVGVTITGPVGGALLIQGQINTTGYRSTARPNDVSNLDADDLLQGGPALSISDDIAGGILFDVRPPNNDPDEDDEDGDGIDDDEEGNAAVTSLGEAPAVQIGSTSDTVTIGAVAGDAADGNGIVINGTMRGSGVYDGVAGNALVVGGLGGVTEIAGGILINGTVRAQSADDDATAIRIGDLTTVPKITNNGEISASGGDGDNSSVYAIMIEENASLDSVSNSRTISAEAAGDGSAGAIIDRSGAVNLIENSGTIEAISEKSGVGKAIAIDLSENDGGATVRQFAREDAAAPSIAGEVRFGAGNDIFDIADGSVVGRLDFGGGADRLTVSDGASFRGSFAGTADAAINVNGGTLVVTNTAGVDVTSLNVTDEGTLGVTIDGRSGSFTQFRVAGIANFDEGTKLEIDLDSVSESEGRYQIVDAGTLTGSENLESDGVVSSYMFKSSVSGDDDEGAVWVDIKRKTAAELNLTRSQASAYDEIFKVLDNDEAVASGFLNATTAEIFDETIQQMLPDHAGGVFATVSQGSRSTARFLTDPVAPYSDQGGWGFWLQQTVWDLSKDRGQTDSYDITGLGTTAGIEIETGSIGNFGISLGYLNSNDSDDDAANEVDSDQYEFAAYWRARWGGLRAFARGSYAKVDFESQRRFETKVEGDDQPAPRFAVADWSGDLYSLAGGLAYELDIGRVSLRPSVSVDYYNLSEDGYEETEGGDAFNLIVEERESDELALNTTLAAALNFGDTERDGVWFRVEAEGGYRQIIGGEIGDTIARFEDGDAFTLSPDTRTDGWLGGLRLVSGTGNLLFAGEVSAEEQLKDEVSVGVRLSLRIGF
ncbi:autotransporter outer membrane beta-barrel domain-containing protein [Parasphingorhabdus litoris]|uniref:Autotransporter outer membrane beta-barrel domain-containing protein n=1 Tax=Parasphingorhabdus litoris TaxID=394733 RepID=A0ABN1AYH5_9SPHN|nr:autotransporter domain-containing protein [Parasphingorhabdus litoris]